MGLLGSIKSIGKKIVGGAKSLVSKGWDSIKGIGSGFLQSAPGMLSGLAGDYLGNQFIGVPNSALSFAQSQQGAYEQWAQAERMYKNRYKWTMEDMKRSGLNPILAVSSGMGVGNTPQLTSAKGFQPHSPYGSGAASAKGFAQSYEAEEGASLKRAQASETIQKTKQAFEQTRKIMAETRVTSQTEKNLRQEWFNIDKQYDVLTKQIEHTQKSIYQLETRGDLNQAERRKVEAEKQQIKINTQRLKQEVLKAKAVLSKLQTISDVYKTPYFGQALSGISETLKTIAKIIPFAPSGN